jgi:hypothetical protein
MQMLNVAVGEMSEERQVVTALEKAHLEHHVVLPSRLATTYSDESVQPRCFQRKIPRRPSCDTWSW